MIHFMPIPDRHDKWYWRLWLYLAWPPMDRYHRDYIDRLHRQINEQNQQIAELRRLLRDKK